MRFKVLAVTALAMCGALALAVTGGMAAKGPAKTTVTLKVQGSGDFSGKISSPKPKKCAKNRKVVVFRQKGAKQKPKADTKIASDNADRSGNKYVWSTGNTGSGAGKYYARAGRIAGCKPDTSKAVRFQPD